MQANVATIKATIVSYLRRALADEDIDFEQLLSQAGIAPEDVENPLNSIPIECVAALFECAAKATGDPCFGVSISDKIENGVAGLMSQLFLTAPDVKSALCCAAKYSSVYMTQMTTNFSIEDGVGYLTWLFPESVSTSRIQYNSYLAALIVRRLKASINPTWVPLSVTFDHRQPDCDLQNLLALFGNRLRFNEPHTSIAVDTQSMSFPMPKSDPVLFAMFEDLAKRWISEEQSQPSVVLTTRNEVAASLGKHESALENIADKMGMSTRALQWRLSQAGTSFEAILGDVRKDLARHLLQDTDRPLADIAYDLGYADPSIFTRAAKRWFGMAPRTFRQMHR